jgi:hypothetical protein
MPNPRLFRPRSSSLSDEVTDPTTTSTAFTFGDSNDSGLTILEPPTDDNSSAQRDNTDLKMLDYISSSTLSNPCASNDAGSDYLQPCTYDYPRPAFLSCLASDANELMFEYDAGATTFEYDYELHTPYNDEDGEASFVEIVDEFQNGLAGSLAADFGVYCTHVDEDVRRRRNRRLGKEFDMNTTDDAIGGGGMYAPVCLGVSSSPSDVADDFISELHIM